MRDPGGARVGGEQLDERLADAASLVAVGHGERDLGTRAPFVLTHELSYAGRKRIALDVRHERVPARVDPGKRAQLSVGKPRLGAVEAAKARLRAEPLEQRSDRVRVP